MVRVIWTKEAVDDLERIHAYVAEHDGRAAERLIERIVAAGESLASFPNRGRRLSRNMRALSTVWPYIIAYASVAGSVRIAAIRHGARRPLP